MLNVDEIVDDETDFEEDTPHFNTTSPAFITVILTIIISKSALFAGIGYPSNSVSTGYSSAWGMLSETSASLDWPRENPFGVLGVSRDFSASC